MAASLLLLLLFYLLARNNLFIQLVGKSGGFSHFEINLFLIFTSVFSGIVWLNFLAKERIVKVFLFIFGTMLILPVLLIYIVIYNGVNYTNFSSLDHKADFRVIESNAIRIYQIKNPFLIKKVAELPVKRRYQPFYNDNYKLEWTQPNELKIYYFFNHTSTEFREVLINYE